MSKNDPMIRMNQKFQREQDKLKKVLAMVNELEAPLISLELAKGTTKDSRMVLVTIRKQIAHIRTVGR